MTQVSAIISTYNNSRLLEGCIRNLLNQSINKDGNLEIVVIDSGSVESEGEIVRSFRNNYSEIKYIRTENRESLYQAWNRGIEMASGQYITNANTDDRHHFECIERLVNKLEKQPDCDVAYGNLYKSAIPNEIFEENDKSLPCYSQNFFPGSLLLQDFIGAQPLWRKSLHDKLGMFDESYEIVGDYEFFLRAVSLGCKFSFVPKAEGLMLWHRDALSTKSSDVYAEKKILFKNYRTPEKILDIYQNVLLHPNRTDQTDHMLDLGVRCLCYYPQFSNGSPHFDFSFAQYCFEHIPESKLRLHNLEALEKVRRTSVPGNSPIVPNTKVVFWGSTQDFPSEAELNCAKPTYLTRSGTKELDGKIHQMFEFDLDIFFSNLFGHLPAVKLFKAKNLFIWGLNERGKLLINFLNRDSAQKTTFIDSKAKILKDSQSDASFSLIDFEEVSAPSDSIFVLAMSSYHWPAITDKITKNFPAADIFTIDQS